MARVSINKTGERKLNKYGDAMTIIGFNGTKSILVEFETGEVIVKQYNQFLRGGIKKPSGGDYEKIKATFFENIDLKYTEKDIKEVKKKKSNIAQLKLGKVTAICNGFTFDENQEKLKEWLHYEFGISKQNIANIFWSNYHLDNIKEIDNLIIPSLNINYKRSSIKSKCKLKTHPWELVECEAFMRINCNGRLDNLIKASRLRGLVAGRRLESSDI